MSSELQFFSRAARLDWNELDIRIAAVRERMVDVRAQDVLQGASDREQVRRLD